MKVIYSLGAVMFGAYVLHVRHQPYMTHNDKALVIKEHEAKVRTFHFAKLWTGCHCDITFRC